VHQGEAVIVPALVRRSAMVRDGAVGDATELLVQRVEAVDSDRSWVILTEPEDTQRLILLGEETARLLGAALTRVAAE
jgi:hypothetical protein